VSPDLPQSGAFRLDDPYPPIDSIACDDATVHSNEIPVAENGVNENLGVGLRFARALEGAMNVRRGTPIWMRVIDPSIRKKSVKELVMPGVPREKILFNGAASRPRIVRPCGWREGHR